ncbi:hypothetical protein PAMP_003683 [Pampus punctatissimus]
MKGHRSIHGNMVTVVTIALIYAQNFSIRFPNINVLLYCPVLFQCRPFQSRPQVLQALQLTLQKFRSHSAVLNHTAKTLCENNIMSAALDTLAASSLKQIS